MRCVFRLSDGRYMDREDSHPPGVSSADMLTAGNVARFGAAPSDCVVVETDDPAPHLCRLVAGKVVRDKALVDVQAAAVQADDAKAARVADLKAKVAAKTATHEELCEVVAGM